MAGLVGKMIRLGIVGLGSSHSSSFASILNGICCEPLGEARVTMVFDESRKVAEEFSKQYQVPHVVEYPDDMIGEVDGVLILYPTYETFDKNAKYGRPFVESGMPTFIDKLPASNLAEAVSFVDLAHARNAMLMSCSALRYSIELENMRNRMRQSGALRGGICRGPGFLIEYGVHAIEAIHQFFGPGIEHVYCESDAMNDVGIIAYSDGKRVAIEILRDSEYLFHMAAYAERGWDQTVISDAIFYRRMLKEFVNMVQTRVAPIAYESMKEVLLCIFALELSGKESRKVFLSELREGHQE